MTGDFFINKTATRSICLLDLPTYLLSETRKYIDESSLTPKLFSQLTTEPPKPDDELYQGKKTNIQVHNYYFEKTPLSKVKNIVLENGFFTPQSFKKIFPLQKISNYLTDSL
jgi:translation initiation factor 2B subunit (eIF-2B alpha/beta/delta family)